MLRKSSPFYYEPKPRAAGAREGGEKRVVVPDDVPVVSYEPADRTALTVGANVLINGSWAEDGSVTAAKVSVGKNGLAPPM